MLQHSGSTIDAVQGYLGLTEPRSEYIGNYYDDYGKVGEDCIAVADNATCSSPYKDHGNVNSADPYPIALAVAPGKGHQAESTRAFSHLFLQE